MSRVDALLDLNARHKDLSANSRLYAALAKRQGYDAAFVRRHFPVDDLPSLEIGIPLVDTNDVDSWKQVQSRLRDLGLYDGAIDGVLGRGSMSAIYGLLSELEPLLIQRSYTAMKRAQNMLERTNGCPSAGYGAVKSGDAQIFGQVRKTSEGVETAGYYGREETGEGYSRFNYGYSDAATGFHIWGWQTLADGQLNDRYLDLRIANGSFSILRTESVTFDYRERGASEGSRFSRAQRSPALPVEPLPGADLIVEPDDSVRQVSGDIIIDYHDAETVTLGSCDTAGK